MSESFTPHEFQQRVKQLTGEDIDLFGTNALREQLNQRQQQQTEQAAKEGNLIAMAEQATQERLPEVLTELDISHQYTEQLDILRQAGILETKDGQEGITDQEAKFYPIPTAEQVLGRLEASIDMVETKSEQGFTKLLLVPFAMSIAKLSEIYGNRLKQTYEAGKLVSSDGTKLKLDTAQPAWIDGDILPAESQGQIVYYPDSFTSDHHGQTKQQVIDSSSGWQILLVEDMTDIPAQGEEQDIGGRTQLKAGQSPNQYLDTIQQDPQYQNEVGLTHEAWLTLAISRLNESDQVLDDWQGEGKVSWLTGSYLPNDNQVPNAYFYRNNRQVDLVLNDPVDAYDYNGVRSSVRIP